MPVGRQDLVLIPGDDLRWEAVLLAEAEDRPQGVGNLLPGPTHQLAAVLGRALLLVVVVLPRLSARPGRGVRFWGASRRGGRGLGVDVGGTVGGRCAAGGRR